MKTQGAVTTIVATVALAAGYLACSGSTEPTPAGGASSGTATSTSGGGKSSSGSTTGDVPCGTPDNPCFGAPSSSSGAVGPTPQTITTATLSGPQCPKAGTSVMVGYFPEPNAKPPIPGTPAKDSWQDKPLTLACTVKPSGDGFAVTSAMTWDGNTVQLNGVTPVGADGFIAYANLRGAEYKHKNCKVDFTTPSMGVAAGRFWATISCAAEAGDDCAIDAEIRLENCSQQ